MSERRGDPDSSGNPIPACHAGRRSVRSLSRRAGNLSGNPIYAQPTPQMRKTNPISAKPPNLPIPARRETTNYELFTRNEPNPRPQSTNYQLRTTNYSHETNPISSPGRFKLPMLLRLSSGIQHYGTWESIWPDNSLKAAIISNVAAKE